MARAIKATDDPHRKWPFNSNFEEIPARLFSEVNKTKRIWFTIFRTKLPTKFLFVTLHLWEIWTILLPFYYL